MFGFSVPELLVLAFVGIFARWSYIGLPGPSWVRFHPIDGLMTALIGASVAALGWHVESWGLLALGAAFVVVGLWGSVRAVRARTH